MSSMSSYYGCFPLFLNEFDGFDPKAFLKLFEIT